MPKRTLLDFLQTIPEVCLKITQPRGTGEFDLDFKRYESSIIVLCNAREGSFAYS